jgi:hypothetical protein
LGDTQSRQSAKREGEGLDARTKEINPELMVGDWFGLPNQLVERCFFTVPIPDRGYTTLSPHSPAIVLGILKRHEGDAPSPTAAD